ncbi:hypothetical protein B0H13DRAFT_1913559 [Mycena leptocephala]|nr:hypothetical protein B0H13DRAFT_1913559 [Mycena leptocephala]
MPVRLPHTTPLRLRHASLRLCLLVRQAFHILLTTSHPAFPPSQHVSSHPIRRMCGLPTSQPRRYLLLEMNSTTRGSGDFGGTNLATLTFAILDSETSRLASAMPICSIEAHGPPAHRLRAPRPRRPTSQRASIGSAIPAEHASLSPPRLSDTTPRSIPRAPVRKL